MIAHYHLIGIGGIGMGTLASLLLAKGYKVSGSDLKESEITAKLKKQGATIYIGHQAANVQQANFVVYSSAVRMNNPEMMETVSRNIPLLKRAQVLAQLVNEQTGITVAGAHGKTTTSSMIASMLTTAQLNPTIAVGGIVKQTETSSNLGQGKYFVAEVDESDGTFLYFRPHLSVITNIDFEHVDFYKDWEGITSAYTKFIDYTVSDGVVIACGEDKRLVDLVTKSKVPHLLYGFNSQLDIYARDVKVEGFGSTFTCYHGSKKIGDFTLSVVGMHNVLNALACIAVGVRLDVPVAMMQQALKEFTGVKRRFHLKGEVDGVMVVDDYGHHPTELRATIEAARLLKRPRLVVVFQPHRYSRTKFLLDEFVEVLTLPDVLILTDVYAASEKPSEGIGVEPLLQKVQDKIGSKAIYLKKEEILKFLEQHTHSGDLVLFLGAGDIYHFSDELVKNLAALEKH